MDSRYNVDEASLSRIDRLGLAYCRLNRWEWDEILGQKPSNFDNLPLCDEYDIERIQHPILMRIMEKINPEKYRRKVTRYDYIKPAIKAIEAIIGVANTNRYWWIFELKRSEDEWLRWYCKGGHADE